MYVSITRQFSYAIRTKCKETTVFFFEKQAKRGFSGCYKGCNFLKKSTNVQHPSCTSMNELETSKHISYKYFRPFSSKAAFGIHENISPLQMKKRPQKKKRSIQNEEDMSESGHWNAVAYATADEYNLEKMVSCIKLQELYDVSPVDPISQNQNIGPGIELDVVHASARYNVGSEPREFFIFREGTIVVWNMDDLECSNLLAFVRSFEENSYDELLVQSESDMMPYSYTESGESALVNGVMLLKPGDSILLDKYTFSNAMALSVKLGIWEASLDRYVDSIEYVTEDLKRGRKIKMTREEVLRKTGELFALRHLMNLSSDLLDTPDFYWDREIQEALYHQTCTYFSIQRRTKVMNEKLNHCLELVELLSSHLNDKHHVRLEWMIIILIMVEVGFEIIHYIDRFS